MWQRPQLGQVQPPIRCGTPARIPPDHGDQEVHVLCVPPCLPHAPGGDAGGVLAGALEPNTLHSLGLTDEPKNFRTFLSL